MFTTSHRPQKFSEVAGQELVKSVLKAIVKDSNKAPKSIILQGGYGTGKCVPGDVRVMTGEGYIRIKDMKDSYNEGFNEFVTKIASRGGEKETSHFYYEKNCKVYNLKLDNSYEVRGTGKHRVLAYKNGEVNLIS